MTSQINPNNIDGTYPVAGQDNNSQGFRDNFTNTSTNFGYAADEITDLQTNAVLKAALTGTTLNNDMLGAPLNNALLYDIALRTYPWGVKSGSVPIDYLEGQVYTVTTGGNISLGFSNFPDTGYGWVTVIITVTNPTYTVTFPSAVSVNTAGIQGLNTSTNIMSFAVAGVYTFTFSTVNAGTTIAVSENNKQLQPYNNSSDIWASGPVSVVTTTTLFPDSGTNVATLPAGVNGQIKVLTQSGGISCLVTVTNAGWAGAGTVELTNQGESVTLQYISGAWYCIGNNGALLA